MAYTKQTWATGDTITAAKLNHMEDGIAAGGDDYDLEFTFSLYYNAEQLLTNATGEGVGASFTELCDKILSGEPLKVKTIQCQYTGSDLTVKSAYVSQSGAYNAYDENMPTPGATLSCADVNFTMSSADMLYGGATFSYVYDSTAEEYTITYTPE